LSRKSDDVLCTPVTDPVFAPRAPSRAARGGQDLIARTLARAGWKVSARSVGRYRKAKAVPPPLPEAPRRKANPVRTCFVHHTWMMDVTQIRQFLGTDIYLAAVFDAHSRVPLLLRIFDTMPGAAEMAALLRRAVEVFGNPKYLLTDLGGEFAGELFAQAVARLGIVHRFASADNIKATARLERFWRSLKEMAGLRGLQLALTVDDLERRLEVALLHYLCFRPHEGLEGATPLEVFLGVEPAHLCAVEPPRGRPGQTRTLRQPSHWSQTIQRPYMRRFAPKSGTSP
jgi:transposase InsO family protein